MLRNAQARWTNRELILTDSFVGVAVSENESIKTKGFIVRYSKSGIHIVPTAKEVKRHAGK